MMKVVTRIAPSNTGFAHIGTARTALFNWLYARQNGGEFLIRIEDTDKERNIDEAIQPIMDGLAWIGLDHDREIVMQSANVDRHREVALELLAKGHAYRCYLTADELRAQRLVADKGRVNFLVRSPWRDLTPLSNDWGQAVDTPYSIRLKMPRDGSTTIDDLVQGSVTVQNSTLDDMIILRADGTPTYMLAVVVDDHDSGVTTVIRGDDHLNNAFRQLPIYRAMGWSEPRYGHLPLIYDEAGKKLSKRHGAAGLETYREGGYLPDAMFNYLLRMGWGSGDHEIISRDHALKLFSLDDVGKAPARIDQKRLDHLNGVYIRDMTDIDFQNEIMRDTEYSLNIVTALVPLIKERSKTIVEAREYIDMVGRRPNIKVDDPDDILSVFNEKVWRTNFTPDEIKSVASGIADERGIKLKHVVAPIRLAIVGSKISPPLFEVMVLLGANECQERIQFAITGVPRVRSHDDVPY